MKTKIKTAIVLLALGASGWMATAQDNDGPPRGDRPPRREGPGRFGGGPGGPGGPGGREVQGGLDRDGQRPPAPPLMAALDANHDGVIDDVEIANASAALKKLDKNGDGKLTMEELRPPRREGFRGQGGQGGPGGRPGQPGGPRGPRGADDRGPGGFGGQRPPAGERPPPPPPEN